MYKTILILTSLCLLSCTNKTTAESNTEKTINWIETHKKPIQVETFIYDKASRNYTLFSADNKIIATGTVYLELPSIITDSVKIPESIIIEDSDDIDGFRERLMQLEKMKRNERYIQEITEEQ